MNMIYLIILYSATIIVSRVALWIWPRHAPKIGNFQLHHYMYGLLLIVLYFFIPQNFLLVIGLGLFVDELPLFFIFRGFDWPDDHWKQYHSWQSVFSIAGISALGLFGIYFI